MKTHTGYLLKSMSWQPALPLTKRSVARLLCNFTSWANHDSSSLSAPNNCMVDVNDSLEEKSWPNTSAGNAAATIHRGSSGTLPWWGGKKFRKCTRFMDSNPGEDWKLPFVGRGGCEEGREEGGSRKQMLAGGRSQRGQQEPLFVWEAELPVCEGSTPPCNSWLDS